MQCSLLTDYSTPRYLPLYPIAQDLKNTLYTLYSYNHPPNKAKQSKASSSAREKKGKRKKMYPSPPHHLQIRQHLQQPPPQNQPSQPTQQQHRASQSQAQPNSRPSASCIPCRNRKVKVSTSPPLFLPIYPSILIRITPITTYSSYPRPLPPPRRKTATTNAIKYRLTRRTV